VIYKEHPDPPTLPPTCPHLHTLRPPPEAQRRTPKALDPADLGERRPPPPPAPPGDIFLPSISIYSVAVCGTDSFSMDNLKPRRLENMCVSFLTWHIYIYICVCVCVWSFDCWCESACDQWFLLTMCHICRFKSVSSSVLCEKNLFSNKCQKFRERPVLHLLFVDSLISAHTHTRTRRLTSVGALFRDFTSWMSWITDQLK